MEDLTENNTRESSAVQEGIVLKDRNGNDVIYYGIETVTFDTTTEGKQQTYSKGVVADGIDVQLDLSDGDQTIQAPEGYLVKEATIKKPETLLPENIKKGATVAGVAGAFEGNFIGDITVELDLSNGDQTLQAPEGYGVTSATIKKPETLVPKNIADGIEVAGVLGTHKGGGEMDDPNLKDFAYVIDDENKRIILHKVVYAAIYADTGSYDVVVPDQIAGYNVYIAE